MCAVRVFASFSAKIESESPLQPMSYRLTITATTIATINFESEESARDWMESWEEQDYKNLIGVMMKRQKWCLKMIQNLFLLRIVK
jgi:hypothetical protein